LDDIADLSAPLSARILLGATRGQSHAGAHSTRRVRRIAVSGAPETCEDRPGGLARDSHVSVRMQPFPHHYAATASARADDLVRLESPGLPELQSAAPKEFDGPGDRWSPETLLAAAVADCFVLTFRGIATLSRLPWTALVCDVEGTVDRSNRVTRFTAFRVRARLEVPEGANEEQARRLLLKAEQTCIVTASLKVEAHVETEVVTAQPAT
jgi:organic hydroperoxide reductase OsmC/OhrA